MYVSKQELIHINETALILSQKTQNIDTVSHCVVHDLVRGVYYCRPLTCGGIAPSVDDLVRSFPESLLIFCVELWSWSTTVQALCWVIALSSYLLSRYYGSWVPRIQFTMLSVVTRHFVSIVIFRV